MESNFCSLLKDNAWQVSRYYKQSFFIWTVIHNWLWCLIWFSRSFASVVVAYFYLFKVIFIFVGCLWYYLVSWVINYWNVKENKLLLLWTIMMMCLDVVCSRICCTKFTLKYPYPMSALYKQKFSEGTVMNFHAYFVSCLSVPLKYNREPHQRDFNLVTITVMIGWANWTILYLVGPFAGKRFLGNQFL